MTVAFSDYEIVMLALCMYREARGQSPQVRRAVAWTVRNRVVTPSWWGHSWVDVITKHWQFSSFNQTDPNSVVWPLTNDSVWQDCLSTASEVYAGQGVDLSAGATYYYDDSIAPPTWTEHMIMTVKLGRLNFFKEGK